MSKVWLVTGSGRGLGRDIAEAVLATGDRLVAGARDTTQLDELVAQYGDRIRAVTLDVTNVEQAQAAVAAAISTFGKLDVLVNNAGYGHLAPFEQTDDAAFRAQIETNFFGVVNLSRAAVPVMRTQRSGHIIQISSVGGRMGTPGMSAYQSAKWAVGGFTEVLAQELQPFGIKVVTLEPGGMRTNWGYIAKAAVPTLLPDYEDSIGGLVAFMQKLVGNENSAPSKVAEVVLKIGYHEQPPVHLLLGSDAYGFAGSVDAARAADAEVWSAVSRYPDISGEGSLSLLPEGRELIPFSRHYALGGRAIAVPEQHT